MKIVNLENENRKFVKTVNNFHVLEYIQDASVSPMNAQTEYFMSQMNVRRRQIVSTRNTLPLSRLVPCSGWAVIFRQLPE